MNSLEKLIADILEFDTKSYDCYLAEVAPKLAKACEVMMEALKKNEFNTCTCGKNSGEAITKVEKIIEEV